MSINADVKWSEEETNELLEYCKNILNYKTLKDLELRARAGTGTEDLFHLNSQCCNDKHQCNDGDSKCSNKPFYSMKKNDDDILGALLDDFVSNSGLKEIVPMALEKAALAYTNVVKKATVMDGEAPTLDEQIEIRQSVLRESLIYSVLRRLTQFQIGQQRNDASEGGLLAAPGYRNGPLDSLRNETLADLMKTGLAIQDGFLGETMRRNILCELQDMDYDGQFRDANAGTISIKKTTLRQDRICWMTLNQLDREQQKGLFHLFERLASLPFELNKKASLFCQVITVLQCDVFDAHGTIYGKHMDGGYKEHTNNGRKITAIYFPNDNNWEKEYGGYLRIHPPLKKANQLESIQTTDDNNDENNNDDKILFSEENTDNRNIEKQSQRVRVNTISNMPRKNYVEISPKGDRLVLFKTRETPYEILPTYKKRYAITTWISGPIPPYGED